jgi:hypothetical protein
VSSENIHGSKIVSTVAFWPLTVAVGIILIFFIRRHLVLNLFPLPLSTEKLLGELCYNMQSVKNKFPRFVYPFVSLILCQYYWCCNFYSTYGRSAAKKKKSAKFLSRRWEFTLLRPQAPRFAYKCRVQHSTNNVSCVFLYSANTIGATLFIPPDLFFKNLPINWIVLTGNGNLTESNWKSNKTTK